MKRYTAEPEPEESQVDFEFENEGPMVGIDEIEEDDSKTGFPDEYREPLRGLIFLGKLSKNFEYAGHDFLIETITEGDTLRVGQLLSEYKGTFSEVEARKALTVAACIRAVDGYAVYTPISNDSDGIYERFQIVKKWYRPVVDYVYRRFVELETTEFAVANALKKE